jgi:rod shape-determining protein MreC
MKRFSRRSLLLIILSLVVAGVFTLGLSGYLRPILSSLSNPFISLQRWVSTRYLAISNFFTMPRDVSQLMSENAQLQSQVSQLESQIIELQQQLSEAQIVYALLDFARTAPQNQYVGAAIIGRDPSPFLQYVIIDHGSDDGIRYGMPVVTNQGLVGIVDAVTATAARVKLITDSTSVVNVNLENTGVSAQLLGSVTGEMTLDMIPQDADVQAGDIILTSGLGGTYPADIVVGQVVSVHKQQTGLFQTANIQPSVDFSKLNAVLIITNFHPVDIEPLVPTQAP